MTAPKCSIDSDILNEDSLADMEDIGLSFFASTCGKNRGAFVLHPPDGHTYGCLSLPDNFPELAGVEDIDESIVSIPDANAIKEQYEGNNITAADAVNMLDYLVQSVYNSTPDPNASPYACEFNGLAKLTCPKYHNDASHRTPRTRDRSPIRSVTLAGLLVDALWATGGTSLTLAQMKDWYSLKDFQEMKDLGLNTVQILVPTAAFVPNDKEGAKAMAFLQDLLKYVEKAELQAVLALVATGDELDAVVEAASFCADNPSTVLAMTLPSETTLDLRTTIQAIRVQAPKLPLFLPMHLGMVGKLRGDFDEHVYGSLALPHTATIADIASSESQEDRSKLFYHEATSCMGRSPLEFSACFQDLPLFVSSGFDLSIDDCVNQDILSTFQDYGQCDRFDETVNSNWWFQHRASFAARQLYAYERGLGWSFAAWKLYDRSKDGKADGLIDRPAKLLSLKDVAQAGLLPPLDESIPAQEACLNPPQSDFVLGDDTLAPTLAPPPDCGNGWWNFTTEKCDYWIPPPEPTPAPTEPCPVCDNCAKSLGPMAPSKTMTGVLGLVIGAIIGAGVVKVLGDRDRRTQYEQIPN